MGTKVPSWARGRNQKHSLTELVKIRIGIVPVFEINPTKYKILVDNTLLFETNDAFVSGATQYHDLAVQLDAGPHNLHIRAELTGRQFENIEIVEIAFNDHKLSDIDLFSLGEYLLDQPRLIDGIINHKVDQCTNLGWPGTYQVKFATPIMLWTIRNLNIKKDLKWRGRP